MKMALGKKLPLWNWIHEFQRRLWRNVEYQQRSSDTPGVLDCRYSGVWPRFLLLVLTTQLLCSQGITRMIHREGTSRLSRLKVDDDEALSCRGSSEKGINTFGADSFVSRSSETASEFFHLKVHNRAHCITDYIYNYGHSSRQS